MTHFVAIIVPVVVMAILPTNAAAQGMIRGSAWERTYSNSSSSFNTAFYKSLAAWKSLGEAKTSCYNMTYQEFCWPCDGGEVEVVVRDNQVVIPSNGRNLIKTMDELYQIAESDCVKGCPGSDQGCSELDDIVACSVGYTTKYATDASKPSGFSYISSFSYRMNELIADGGYSVKIRDIRFCDVA